MTKALVCAAVVWGALSIGCMAKVNDDGSDGSSALSGGDGKSDPGKGDPGKEDPGPSDPGKPGCGDPGKDPGKDPGGTCRDDIVFSKDKSCLDSATLEKLAVEQCAASGAKLASFFSDDACGKGAGYSAKIVCCGGKEEPPPPPPPKCEGLFYESKTCVDPGTLKLIADKDCSARGETLAEIWPDMSCADGGSHAVKYTCCAVAIDPPPPPPPTKCEGLYFESKECVDPATAKATAAKDCASRGEELTDIGGDGSCKDGGSHAVKYTCCAVSPDAPPPPEKK